MIRVISSIALAAAVAIGAPPAAAETSVYTIRTKQGVITSIGSLGMSGPNGGTLARARALFGRPSQIRPIGDGRDACTVKWRALGLDATFANFGIESACSSRGGRLQAATIHSARFRTSGGVRVGDRSSTIRAKHPSARFVDGSWWIASASSQVGADEPIVTVRALVRDGRVVALKLWVGAAGD